MMNNIEMNDKPREECGVFGIYSKEIKKDILKTLKLCTLCTSA